MLRFISTDRADAPASKPSPISTRRLGLTLLAISAVSLGGCSSEFLRFDSPVFNLSDEDSGRLQASADAGGEYAPTGATLAQSGSANSYDTGGYRAPVASVQSEPRVRSADGRPQSVVLASTSPPPQRQSDVVPLTTGALGNPGTITVERGDTLYQLSRRHGVSVAALKDANGLSGNIIRPGQTLRLPSQGAAIAAQDRRMPVRTAPRAPSPPTGDAGGFVTVESGDSLYAISRRTGVSVSELKRINNIEDVRRLRPGMRLALGATGGAVPAAGSEIAQPQRPVISRTDFGQASTIKAKPIRTVSIGRDMAPAASTAPEQMNDANAPRILNGAGAAAAQPAAGGAEASDNGDAEGTMKFRWPAKGRIIATFNDTGRGVKNDGINISLPIGTPIHAVESGTVAYAGSELKGYGNLILLRHENGWVSAYAHASELLVKRGDKVEKGQVIAKAGRSGGVTQPQLHFELRRQAKPVDPLPHMAAM
jgi:murein DD-endopeptidase MepM/ murein hydrolase activator NlpD